MAKRIFILCGIIAILLFPFLGEYMETGGNIPDGFFYYPSLTAQEKAGFNIWVFLGVVLFVFLVALVYIYPKLFGFKSNNVPNEKNDKKPFPITFYCGILLSAFFTLLLFGKFSQPTFLVQFGFIPAFIGYFFILDGILCRRTRGISMLSKQRGILLPMAISSAIGWGFFAYLNFFVNSNWCYPFGNEMSQLSFYIYAFIGGMTLSPLVFVTYYIFQTIPLFKNRYRKGLQIVLTRPMQIGVLIANICAMFAVSYFPNELFVMLWIGPTLIFATILDMLGIWTPFQSIAKRGDWNSLAIFALACFLQGFLWEGTNFLSASHTPLHSYVPGFWIYSIPYVDIAHVFEMPILGFFGYMPYGIFCLVFWICFAHIFNIPTKIKLFNNEEL